MRKKWNPEVVIRKFRIDSEDYQFLLENLASLIYDAFCQLTPEPKCVPIESKTSTQINYDLERTGSDG